MKLQIHWLSSICSMLMLFMICLLLLRCLPEDAAAAFPRSAICPCFQKPVSPMLLSMSPLVLLPGGRRKIDDLSWVRTHDTTGLRKAAPTHAIVNAKSIYSELSSLVREAPMIDARYDNATLRNAEETVSNRDAAEFGRVQCCSSCHRTLTHARLRWRILNQSGQPRGRFLRTACTLKGVRLLIAESRFVQVLFALHDTLGWQRRRKSIFGRIVAGCDPGYMPLMCQSWLIKVGASAGDWSGTIIVRRAERQLDSSLSMESRYTVLLCQCRCLRFPLSIVLRQKASCVVVRGGNRRLRFGRQEILGFAGFEWIDILSGVGLRSHLQGFYPCILFLYGRVQIIIAHDDLHLWSLVVLGRKSIAGSC